jgi:hypothetical protein
MSFWPSPAAVGLLGLAVAVLSLPYSSHAQSADQLATKLADLRAEVEQLSEQLTKYKVDTRNELQSLARQKSDLRVEVDREQVRVQKLRFSLAERRSAIDETAQEGEDLGPAFETAVGNMRAYISQSLPFRRQDRLSELENIEEQRRTGILSYPRALARLWSFAEDELRMTRENAAFRQTITLDGEELLADVVRVGMVMMFFQTSDGVVGYSHKTATGWTFERADNPDQRRQIRELFDTFRKQIRVGFFWIPNALPMEGK